MGLDIYFYTQSKPEVELQNREPRTEVAYFRKFNALWNWINTNVSEIKNCEDVPLTKAHLEVLLHTLNNLTPHNCAKAFPTRDGFFFGATDYDEYYWEDVNELKAKVKTWLKAINFDTTMLYFHAWW